MKKKTAIVILNWNGQKLLERFLPPLIHNTLLTDADIIVADNGSTDGSVAFVKNKFSTVQVRTLDKNYGFAEGYNRVIVGLTGYKYVVLLNSDVEVTANWLTPAVKYLDKHPEVSALQPKILSQRRPAFFEYAGACGGFLDKNGYPLCRGRMLDVVEEDHKQYDTPIEVFWASGACMFIRLQDYKDLGGLDEYFFAHQEEIDLCWRLNARGKKVVCLPQSVVYHVGGATLQVGNSRKTYLNFRNNLLMLYKNMPKQEYRRVMSVRWLLDYLSALHFLILGRFDDAGAIFRARHDFHRMKSYHKQLRKNNLTHTTQTAISGILPKSLIWEFYFRRKKTFSSWKVETQTI